MRGGGGKKRVGSEGVRRGSEEREGGGKEGVRRGRGRDREW